MNASWDSVIAGLDVGIIIQDRDARITFANPKAESMLGLGFRDMVGTVPAHPQWDVIAPDGRPIVGAGHPVIQALESGKPVRDVMLGVRHPITLERIWLLVSATPEFDEHGNTTRAVVTLTDVSINQRALDASRAQVVRVIDALPGVVFQLFRPHRGSDSLPFIGGRVEELFGESSDAMGGDPSRLLRHIHRHDLTRFLGALDVAVRDGTAIETEVAVQGTASKARWLRIHGVPERQTNGVLCTGVILDVTESHDLADALQRSQRRDAMSDLAAGIAHNFNNMLAVILPNVEMAASASPIAERALLEDAAGAARSAADLVAQMLTLGRQDLSEKADGVVDMIPLIRETLRICRSTFDRGISITEENDVAAALVVGQRSQLQQVLLNLCLNARDALAGRSAPVLAVRITVTSDQQLRIEIRDNGHGMSAETLRRLGEPFFTTKAVGKGTGLGVAAAFRTIHQAGGDWTVESTPGIGTTFAVRVPLSVTAVDVAPETAIPEPTQHQGTVLIIDDEAMVRRALSRQLRAAGFDSLEAKSGAEGLAMLRQAVTGLSGGVSVVLLDLSMPGMSGEQVLEHLRVQAPSLPVVVLSGHIANPDALSDASAILQKPATQAQLVTTLRQVQQPEAGGTTTT